MAVFVFFPFIITFWFMSRIWFFCAIYAVFSKKAELSPERKDVTPVKVFSPPSSIWVIFIEDSSSAKKTESSR